MTIRTIKSNFNTSVSTPVTARRTILASLAPKTSFKVSATAVTNNNRHEIGGVRGQVQDQKAAMSEMIRQAQRDIMAATKATGNNVAGVFPDERIAAGGEFGMIVQAGLEAAANGAGSMATFAKTYNSASLYDTVKDDFFSQKGFEQRKEVLADIQDQLIKMQSVGVRDSRADFAAASTFVGDAPEATRGSRFDWQEFFEEGHTLDQLMYTDPENPNPNLFPEWAALQTIEHNLDHADAGLRLEEEFQKSLPDEPEPLLEDGSLTYEGLQTYGHFINCINCLSTNAVPDLSVKPSDLPSGALNLESELRAMSIPKTFDNPSSLTPGSANGW